MSRGTFVLVVAWLAVAASVAAHEGVPRLIPEPEQVNPGGVLTVRVEDLSPEGTVELTLAGASGSVPLATVPIDAEGHALVFLEVPGDLPRGTYSLEADAFGIDVPRWTSSCPVRRSRGWATRREGRG